MLTSLTIVEGTSTATFPAVRLLEIQQQALPGVAKPVVGTGTQQDPWYLATPQEWYWASKNRTEERSWFWIGGRLIRVRTTDNYAADHGPWSPPSIHSLPSLSVTSPTDTSSKRFGDDNGPNYPDIYHQLAKDTDLGSAMQSAAVARQIRALLDGAKTMTEVPSPTLPVLTAAFFISEVKRNYTAFHTGLMLLDLVEAGVHYDTANPEQLNGPQTLSWDKVLWHPEVLEAESKLESAHTGFKQLVKNRLTTPLTTEVEEGQKTLESVKDAKVNKDVFGKDISRDVRGGEHPMAHTGSIAHSAGNLLGSTQQTSLTVTRQKEANLLIRWLQHALRKNAAQLTVTISAGRAANENVKDEETLVYKGVRAISNLEGAAIDKSNWEASMLEAKGELAEAKRIMATKAVLSTPAIKRTKADTTLLTEASHKFSMTIGALIQERCTKFKLML